MHYVWVSRYQDTTPPPSNLPQWAEQLYISPFLAELIWKRGSRNIKDMGLFLNPSLKNLSALSDLPGLKQASELIAQAILDGKKLAVWGDYDVDGITATALVVDYLHQHGVKVRPHIPSRMGEGYGLNIPDLQMLATEGVNLVLTVDCGICDHTEVNAGRELGLTMVVSDHHLPTDELPEANAICAPTIAECPCPHLAGVGVAFMLMAGVDGILAKNGYPKVDIRKMLDLVALGTLADVSNLAGQNRILVKNGLLVIAGGTRPGIAALKSVCNYTPTASLGASQVVFTLCPRINAAGRLGQSDIALRLMLTEDSEEAYKLASQLDALNTQRRSEEESIQQEAREQASAQVRQGRMGLVLYQPHWHMGVIGIVASRIVEEYNRPAIILCNHGEKIKGSGRSVDGFDLHSALAECSEYFLTFGGHKMAAGLSIRPENLAAFQEKFDAIAREKLGNKPRNMQIKTDGELSIGHTVDQTLLRELDMLQPFGMGNAEPVFTSPPLLIREVKNRTGLVILDVTDEESGITVKAKIWRPKEDIPSSAKGRHICLAYSPWLDRYNGVSTVELRVRDWLLVD